MTTDDDETFPPLNPDDPEEQHRYLRQLQWRYPKETGEFEATALATAVNAGLRLCPPLRINDPKEILRFLALSILLTPAQKRSTLLTTVVYRILMATDTWGARKRLNFIYKFVVGRTPPAPEPDFGVWFIADPRYCPAVAPEDLGRSIFLDLPRSARS
jgi:hypothetical protein